MTAKIQRYDQWEAENNTLSYNNFEVPTNRASALNTKVYTNYSQIFELGAGDFVKLVLTGSDSSLSMVAAGSSLALQMLE